MEYHQGLEKRIKEIGLDIYSTVSEVPPIFDTKKWMGRLMDRAMKDENFKLNLFRYIDVLPSLRTNELVVRLLKEYFSDSGNIPFIIKQGIEHISKSMLPYIAGKAIRAAVETISRQFIVGRDPQDAMASLETLRKNGFAYSVDLLGEVVVSDKEATKYKENYLNLLEFMNRWVPKWGKEPVFKRDNKENVPMFDISLKVSSFFSQIDPIDWEGSIERTKDNLRPLFKKAQEIGASICFDMEQYYYKDLIIAIFKSVLDEFQEYNFAGIAIQAYLKDTRNDILSLIEWAKERKRRISVRLVKGAYWDYEIVISRQKGWPVPVFLSKEDTDRSFEELTRILIASSDFIRPAIATHNIRSISHAIAFAESLDLQKNSVEFQMLYGMGAALRKYLREMSYSVRVYTPIGELISGMAYLVRRLLENTSNESFLRKSFAEKAAFEELIKAPEAVKKDMIDESKDNDFRNEPSIDFSISSNRDRMKDALKKVRSEFNRKYPLYVGGKEIITDAEILSFNPADSDEIVGMVSSASYKDVERAISEAVNVFNDWRKTLPEERAGYLFKAAEGMRKKRFELAALEVYEVGKNWKDADGDIAEAIDYLEYYGHEMIRHGKQRLLGDYPGEENIYLYEPRGIGVVISPWNFPLAIPTGMLSAAIVTGNCVIFRPSGLSPVTGWKLVEIFRDTGIPEGVIQFLPGPGESVGEYLVSHPKIDFIAFTGSKNVGLKILKLSGDTHPGQRIVKKVIAEMGGKNAIIVDETADLDEAVKGILESGLIYQGQKCSACSRIIAVGIIYDELCRRLKEASESVKIGLPEMPDTFMGPVIDEQAFEKIYEYIEIGKTEGNPLLIRRDDREGYFIGPVIFTDVSPDSRIAQEEIFGPVLSIIKSKDIDEAISIANSTVYALTGGIYSRSPSNIKKVKDEFNAGNLYINRKITGALVERQPFGGYGMSGIGSKAGGPDYLLQFMNPKSISENTLRRGFAPLNKA